MLRRLISHALYAPPMLRVADHPVCSVAPPPSRRDGGAHSMLAAVLKNHSEFGGPSARKCSAKCVFRAREQQTPFLEVLTRRVYIALSRAHAAVSRLSRKHVDSSRLEKLF